MAPEGPVWQGSNPEDIRRSPQAENAEWLASLVSDHGLDPGFASEYRPEAAALYVYPGMGPELGEQLDELKAESVRRLHGLCQRAYEDGFDDPRIQRNITQLRRELGAYGSADDPRLAVNMIRRTGAASSAAHALMVGHVGMMRRELYSAVVQTHYVHYFFELGGVNLPVSFVGDTANLIRDFVIDPDVVDADDVGLRDVAIQLRLRDAADLSREHLDARQASHMAIVQVETAVMLLTSLETYARLKPSDGPRRAAALANRYKAALMGDDIVSKVKLARAVADLHRQYGRQIQDRRARLVLEIYARDATAVADELPLAAGMLGLVYEGLGYAVPPALLSLDGLSDTGEATRAAATDAAVGNLAVRREVESQREQLQVTAEAFSRSWRMSARERRQRGFDTMQRALVGGSGEVEESALATIPKDEAKQVIDVLVGLDALAQQGPPDEVADRLAAVLAEELALRGQANELRATAQAAGVPIELPPVAPVEQMVTMLRAQWSGYRELIVGTWPGRQGREVVGRLDLLLAGIA